MTVTSKTKRTKKNGPAFKTKLTKKKVSVAKKDKIMKKKKKIEGKKEVDFVQIAGMKTKKTKIIKSKRDKDIKDISADVGTANRSFQDTDHEVEQEEMITEEGTNELDDSSNASSEDEEHDMTEDEEDGNDNEDEKEGDDDSEGDEEDTEEEDDSEDEDTEEEDDDDDDNEGDEEDEGYAEPILKDAPLNTINKSKANKHVVFGDDETFDDLPDLESNVVKVSPKEYLEDSDSDAPPDEETISGGKDIFSDDYGKMKKEIMELKNQIKETRRLKHEKNREQQIKKHERLEKLEKNRLPEDLLDAVVEEGKVTKPVAIAKTKGKRKTFTEDDNDDEVITLRRGVKVQAIHQELRQCSSKASIAADFRQRALYNKKSPRITSLEQRQMMVKRKKSGKGPIAY